MVAYNTTDQGLHLYSQILAKINRSLVKSQTDDSHTNIAYDPLGERLLGRWFSFHDHNYLISLDLDGLHFNMINDQQEILFSVSTYKKSITTIESELSSKLVDLVDAPQELMQKLHFDIPEYTMDQVSINQQIVSGLSEWKHFRKLANDTCQTVLTNLQATGEVRIWPHHFDTGIYAEPNGGIGLGFGLAMQDELLNQPYFYFSAYPKNNEIDYSKAPKLTAGEWINSNWKGAVLKLNELDKLEKQAQETHIYQFIAAVSKFYLSI